MTIAESKIILDIYQWNDIASVGKNKNAQNLYRKLVLEEFVEGYEALFGNDNIEYLDALIDSVWVAVGLVRAHGIKLSELNEIDEYANQLHPSFAEAYLEMGESPSMLTDNLIKLLSCPKEELVKVANEYIFSCYAIAGGIMILGGVEQPIEATIDCFGEVRRSNYSKFFEDTDGNLLCKKREDGKIMKPESFSKVDFPSVLAKYGYKGA